MQAWQKIQQVSLQLLYGVAGLFALMLAWPFVVSVSRLLLMSRVGADAAMWLLLSALAIAASMLLFNTMRHVAQLSIKQQIMRSLLACGLVSPATVMLMLMTASPP